MRDMNISIRNLPEHLAIRLRARARHNRRTVEAEVLDLLDAGLPAAGGWTGERDLQEVLARLEALDLETPSEAADIIRSDRDR
jgi:plasmid stability protein